MTSDARPREVLARRLNAAGVLEDRLIDVIDGAKKSTNRHADRANRYSNFAPLTGNYGVYAGPTPDRDTWLIDVDIDDYSTDGDADDGLDAVLDLPETLTIETPHTDGVTGGHRFYVVDDPDLPERIRSFLGRDVVNPTVSWGEVRVEHQYVVGPGSQLDECDKSWCDACATAEGGRYEIATDAPIAEIDTDGLLEVLRADGLGDDTDSDSDSRTTGGGGDTGEKSDPGEYEYTPIDADGRAERVVKHDEKIKTYLSLGASAAGFTDGTGDADRSDADWYVCCRMIEYGVPEAQAHDLLDGSPKTKVNERGLEYWTETWDNARRHVGGDAGSEHLPGDPPGVTVDSTPTPDGGADAGTSAGGMIGTGDDQAALEDDPWALAKRRVRGEVCIPYNRSKDDEAAPIDKRTAVDRTANIYHDVFSWVRPRSDTRGWRATLYNYVPSEGIYEPHGEAEIERMIDAHLGDLADNQFVNEVVSKVERKARVRKRRLDEDPERIVVANGILDLASGDLDEHTPAEFHRTRLDVEFDPDASTDAIDDFMHEIVRDRDVDRLYRFIAHSLYRGYPEAKAAMLLGEGENGKTTFLNLVEAFLGGYNVSHESLNKLNEYEWSPARLNGKLANIDADMSDQSPDSMGMFKRLTGEDPIHGEVKFEQPVKFTNHATLMFACNEMPVLNDDTRGNWRRWQLIKFPYVFSDADSDAKDHVPKDELEDRLFTDGEFAGLLARCVEEISAWDDGRAFFPDADSWETTRDKMRRAAEPVYDFAHTCLRPVNDDTVTLPKETVREAYRRYATQQGLKKFTDDVFGKKLLNLTDFNVEAGRIRDDGPRVPVYKGVKLTSRGEQVLQAGTGGDPDDTNQPGLPDDRGVPDDASGQTADKRRVRETLRAEGGEQARGEFLATYCDRYGVTPDNAEAVLQTARKTGVVESPADEVVTLID